MKRVWITGATGFIGSHLVPLLEQHDWAVQAPPRTSLEALPFAAGDVVIHLAGMAHANVTHGPPANALQVSNVELTETLYDHAAEAGVAHFVWLSSIKVLGDESSVPLTVDHPYAPGDEYAESKARAERALLSACRETTPVSIVRPPLVYGPGVQANFLSMLKWSQSSLPLPLGKARAPRAWLSVHNLVAMIRRLIEKPAETAIWHVADDEQTCVADMLKQLAAAGGRKAHVWPVPLKLVRSALRLAGRGEQADKLLAPLPVDDSQTRSLLGWQPPVTQIEALQEVVSWYQTTN